MTEYYYRKRVSRVQLKMIFLWRVKIAWLSIKFPEISVEVLTHAVVVRSFALKTKSLETNLLAPSSFYSTTGWGLWECYSKIYHSLAGCLGLTDRGTKYKLKDYLLRFGLMVSQVVRMKHELVSSTKFHFCAKRRGAPFIRGKMPLILSTVVWLDKNIYNQKFL